MHCFGYCLIAAALLGSLIAVALSCNSNQLQVFKKSLQPNQRVLYERVSRQRMQVFLQGLVLGALLAGLCLFIGRGRLATFNKGCMLTAIVLGTAFLYYMAYPKMMMLDYLDNPLQVTLYTNVYKKMRTQSAYGMIVGVAIALLSHYLSRR